MAALDYQNNPTDADPFASFLGPRRGGMQLVGPDGQPVGDPSQSGVGDPMAGHQVMMMGDGYSADPGDYGMPNTSNGDQTPPPTDQTTPPPTDPGADTTGRTAPPKARIGEPAWNPGSQTWNTPDGNPPGTPAPTPNPAPAPAPQDNTLQNLLAQLIQFQMADRSRVDAQRQSLTDAVSRTITSAEKPVRAEDPEIAGPTDAFNAQGQRARRLMQEQLSQQAVAGGRTSGSVDADVQRSFEDLGNATGSYQGGLMTNELNSRRSQLMAAINAGAGILGTDTMARLQEELGTINAKIQDQGQKNQNTQFYDQLGANLGTHASDLDRILAEMLGQSKAA